MKKYILLIAAFLFLCAYVNAQDTVWQWAVPVKKSNSQIPSRAYLWIPPHCKKVRVILFAQNNMEEQSILENPYFRTCAGKMGLAEVWVSPAYDLFFNFDRGAGEVFDSIMNDLADISGYDELRYAPFIGMGHSAAASAPYYMAVWNPERALAAISVSGQWPYFRSPVFSRDIWGNRNIDYIPCLETMGEYEAADTWSAEGLKERQEHPLMPLSMLASPAQGHFAATDKKCAYIALYIKKAIQYRSPLNTPENKAPKLIPINPLKTGWLVDRWRCDTLPTAPAAPVKQYKGDQAQAFWFFDKELANATVAYEAEYRNKQTELIGFVQDGKMVAQQNTHQQLNLKFEPEKDGITFKLKTAFYDTVPEGSPRPAIWSHKLARQPISHMKSSTNTTVDCVTGPFIKLNDSTFQVHPRLGFWPDAHSYELWFAAVNQGDNVFRPAVQQAQMIIPVFNREGIQQHITFSPITDQRQGAENIKLNAVSDAGLPVRFYVQSGPATINGKTLSLTAIPPRSKFPVKVVVTAWQYGNSNEPKVQTAQQVDRTFWITK